MFELALKLPVAPALVKVYVVCAVLRPDMASAEHKLTFEAAWVSFLSRCLISYIIGFKYRYSF